MRESPIAAGLTAAEAAAMLLWLGSMGADETVAETPVNRFAEPQAPAAVPEPVKPQPARQPSSPPPAVARQEAAAEASIEQTHAAARAASSLAELASLLEGFDAHPLRRTASKLCFAEEAQGARVLVIADRPRNEEDRNGKVLADKHEVLCQRMLAAIGLGFAEGVNPPEPVSFLSFLPWRPPGNRQPIELECRLVLPFAARAIALMQPRAILAFGSLPGQWLAGGAESIQRQRGTWLSVDGIPFLSTFHPEALLKSPALKRLAWLDLLSFRDKLDSLS